MTFDEFLNDVKRKNGVDVDGYYGKQCVDLHNYYCINVLGLAKGKTGADYAKNLINNSYLMQHMERIDNYPAFVPQKGDIAVWRGGKYGHVAIVRDNKSNVNVLRTIDQNWVSQKLTEENHNYTYMAPLVFLRPKNQANINPPAAPVTKNKYNVIVTADVLNVRTGPGTNYKRKTFSELTPNAQAQIKAKCGYAANGLVKGVEATVSETQGNWGKIPSGWICLDYTRKV